MPFKPEYVQKVTHNNDDLLVVNAARVSMGKSKIVFDEPDRELINYLVKHQHKSPFYHPHFCFTRRMKISEYLDWVEKTEDSQFIRLTIDNDNGIISFIERGSLFAYLSNGFCPIDVSEKEEELHYMRAIETSVNAFDANNMLKYVLDLTPYIFHDTGLYELFEGKFTYKQLSKFQTVTTRIKMPVFIAREWFRHCIQKYPNETSRRYVSDSPEFWIPTEWRKAAKNKKQGSSNVPIDDYYGFDHTYRGILHKALNIYDDAIERLEMAPEQARMLLPQAMMTEFVETASLAAYARLVKLRTTPDAQLEIQLYANRINDIMVELFPVSWKALMDYL